jgi:hypothetical protein
MIRTSNPAVLILALSQPATAASLLETFSTDSMEAGFVSSGIPGSWACGEVTSGPLGGEQDTTACGTGLTANYINNAADFLKLPEFDLVSVPEPFLKFSHWWEIAAGDEAVVEHQLTDGTWEQLELVYGYPDGFDYLTGDGGWVDTWVDLTGISDTSDLRLVLRSNQGVTGAGWFVDNLEVWDGDIVPPILNNLSDLPDTEVVTQPYPVMVTALDNRQLDSVVLNYVIDGNSIFSQGMSDVGGGSFQGQIPAQDPDTSVQYWVEAQDGTHSSLAPLVGTNSFRVRLPAPEALSGPDEVIHDDTVWLDWQMPVSIHPLFYYGVYRSGEWLLDAYEPFVQVDLLGDGQDIFTVAGSYELPSGEIVEGDHSDSWRVNSAVPVILSADPSLVYQGDTVHLVVVGTNMLFVQDDVEVTIDSNIEILAVEVDNVDRALITMYVPSDAQIGPRSLYVYSGDSNALLPEAFSVVSGDDLPRIEEIIPKGLRQGQSDSVEFYLSTALSAEPLVDLGPGVLVESVEWTAPDRVTAVVSVDPKAPLGDRSAVLDDGIRAITGAEFDVRDQIIETVGCRVAPNGRQRGVWSLIALCLATIVRRQTAPQ